MTDNTRSAPSEASDFEHWWNSPGTVDREIVIWLEESQEPDFKTVSRLAWNAAIAAAAAIAERHFIPGHSVMSQSSADALAAEIRELEAK